VIDLSIVICCYNKINFTLKTLNDLFHLPANTHEVILIDNASIDKTQEEILKIKRDNFIYIRNETNLFHSAGCNQGYKVSSGKNVLFLNNDINILSNHNSWTNELIKNCDEYVVGASMGLLDGNLNFVREANGQLSGNSYISGWLIASSKTNWNKIATTNSKGNVWDERYPFYFNDGDLSLRIKKLDMQLKIISLPIDHYKQISAKQLNVAKLYSEARKIFVNDWKDKIISK
jgi:GT2 family glycosyltransferase